MKKHKAGETLSMKPTRRKLDLSSRPRRFWMISTLPKTRECNKKKTLEDKLSLKNNKLKLLEICWLFFSKRNLCKPSLMMSPLMNKQEVLFKKN